MSALGLSFFLMLFFFLSLGVQDASLDCDCEGIARQFLTSPISLLHGRRRCSVTF